MRARHTCSMLLFHLKQKKKTPHSHQIEKVAAAKCCFQWHRVFHLFVNLRNVVSLTA